MTLPSQIKEARRALEELEIDEVELTRLHADQLEGIRALKGGGSKNLALLASLEGKQTALATMLSEQRARIVDAAAALLNLEIEQLADLDAQRPKADSLLLDLPAFGQLARTTAARMVRSSDLRAALATARDVRTLGRPDHNHTLYVSAHQGGGL